MDDRQLPTLQLPDIGSSGDQDWDFDERNDRISVVRDRRFLGLLLISVCLHATLIGLSVRFGLGPSSIPETESSSRIQITLVAPTPPAPEPQQQVEVAPEATTPEPAEVAPVEQPPQQVASEPTPVTPAAEPPATIEVVESLPSISEPEPSDAPRLLAPTLPDIRRAVQRSEAIRRNNTIDCDTRQRFSELIDCGDEDPGYDYASAEQHPAALLFAVPLPTDPVETGEEFNETQARVQDNLNVVDSTLSSTRTRRAVMGQ
ncbi:MAG TPA: hypothetical protein DEG76_15970 [Pseudohongiella sp.]|nr:hypothetical protein [Pseudohongiella sp.]|tara:strand:- start:352 stop:1131 length:780 start_codon:yes stop_codon:yes gene_type:complete